MSYTSYAEYLRHPRFRAVVDQVFRRAGGRCENEKMDIYGRVKRCSNKATEPHHVRYCKWGDFDTPDNLLAVCHECHCDFHTCALCGGTLKAEAIKAERSICLNCFMEAKQ